MWWGDLVGTPVEGFEKLVIKKRKPKNTVDAYKGCPLVTVRQSADLYRRIEGWAFGTMLAPRQEIRTNVLPGEDSNLR
ncbi:hypothetical protein [Actinomadura formosensis]|uniref:hypothetical protein n=1 Tax=Actinomadura formosensis TaxID=60706 RepID=UPI0009FD04F3|nr:hypothetical protein [Actinomadura formosensis]